MPDPIAQPDDRFGYSVYALVAHAGARQVELIASARKTIKIDRAMIPAHVTIRGTFHTVDSLDKLRGLLRETAQQLSVARVKFSPESWKFIVQNNGRHLCIMPCETTPGLLALHGAFDSVIRPHSQNAYPDGYRAHMTLCQDCTDEQIAKARELAAGLDVGDGFDVTSAQLMGRAGPAYGGEWKLIESFPLRKPGSPASEAAHV
jgi:2'-5' RNA ligase